jgi:hypothetical protein
MDSLIGYCGYRCDLCAARSDDYDTRKKLVDGWRRVFGHQMYTPENVKCTGCKGCGPIADKSCEARPCAIEKGFQSCTDCDEFACKKVGVLLATKLGMLLFGKPEGGPPTEEDYNLCMRQFDSMPELMKQLVEKGKRPEWMLQDSNEN